MLRLVFLGRNVVLDCFERQRWLDRNYLESLPNLPS